MGLCYHDHASWQRAVFYNFHRQFCPHLLTNSGNRKKQLTLSCFFLKRRYFYGVYSLIYIFEGCINCNVKIFRGFHSYYYSTLQLRSVHKHKLFFLFFLFIFFDKHYFSLNFVVFYTKIIHFAMFPTPLYIL